MVEPRERHIWVWYTPYGLGGVETYLLNMVRETIGDGVPVWVAATKDADGPLRRAFVEAGAQLLDWTGFHPAFMGEQDSRAIRARLAEDLGAVRPTLLALNDCNGFSIGAAPLLQRLRPHCTILDTLHIDSPDDQYLGLRRTFTNTLDAVAATNQNVLQRFRRRYPEACEVEPRYIANGTSVHQRERRPPDSTLKLLYVGRLAHEQKRIMDLPPLLESLRASGRQFSMTIVGDGPSRNDLAEDLTRRGLSGQVQMPGYLPPPQAQELYFTHDVLVNLSTFEGFSMSVLEALAAGCVPVCTEVMSLDRSVFLDGVNCRLCPVDRLSDMVAIWSELTPQALLQLSSGALRSGSELTAGRTYREYKTLIADVRRARAARPWTTEAASTLFFNWEISKDNPWLPRPHPVRRSVETTWRNVQATFRVARKR